MNCKRCGAQLEADMTVCPLCGANVDPAEDGGAPAPAAETPVAEVPVEEAPVEEIPAENVPGEEAPAAETPEEEAPAEETPAAGGKRGLRGGKLALLIAVVVVLAAALVWAVVSIAGGRDGGDAGDGSDPLAMDHVDEAGNFVAHSYTKDNDAITADEMNTVVASCGEYELTNAQLSFYYWQQYYNFMSAAGGYVSMFGMDPTQPLAEQMYTDDASWEDMFLQSAMSMFWRTAAVNQDAEKAGYALDQANSDYLDSLADGMAEEAEANGYESLDAYVQSAYGPHVTIDDYLEFARQMMTASGYVSELYSGIVYDEDDITAYFEDNLDTYAEEGYSLDDPKMVNVRHILIEPVPDEDAETDESGNPVLTEQNWEDARVKAEEIYDMWLSGAATEDSFAELAGEYSSDPGSAATGGLYEEVYPGQMVQTFNDWCFDESRQPGDSGIVETDYGYHIMYFSGQCEHAYWYNVAEQDYVSAHQEEIITGITDEYPIQVDYDKVVLASTDMLS